MRSSTRAKKPIRRFGDEDEQDLTAIKKFPTQAFNTDNLPYKRIIKKPRRLEEEPVVPRPPPKTKPTKKNEEPEKKNDTTKEPKTKPVVKNETKTFKASGKMNFRKTKQGNTYVVKSKLKTTIDISETEIPIITAKSSDIAKALKKEYRPPKKKQLIQIPSHTNRASIYLNAAKAIAKKESEALPSHGARSWFCHVTMKDKQGAYASTSNFDDDVHGVNKEIKGKMSSSPLFVWHKYHLELAVLPHLLDSIDAIDTDHGLLKSVKETSDLGTEDGYDTDDDIYIRQLMERPVTVLSTVAHQDSTYVIPSIDRKWVSPDLITFRSRNAAVQHALMLLDRDKLIDRVIHGIGSRGALLRPVKPTKKLALEAGYWRFVRDGLWVVGQEEEWIDERIELLQKEKDAEKKRVDGTADKEMEGGKDEKGLIPEADAKKYEDKNGDPNENAKPSNGMKEQDSGGDNDQENGEMEGEKDEKELIPEVDAKKHEGKNGDPNEGVNPSSEMKKQDIDGDNDQKIDTGPKIESVEKQEVRVVNSETGNGKGGGNVPEVVEEKNGKYPHNEDVKPSNGMKKQDSGGVNDQENGTGPKIQSVEELEVRVVNSEVGNGKGGGDIPEVVNKNGTHSHNGKDENSKKSNGSDSVTANDSNSESQNGVDRNKIDLQIKDAISKSVASQTLDGVGTDTINNGSSKKSSEPKSLDKESSCNLSASEKTSTKPATTRKRKKEFSIAPSTHWRLTPSQIDMCYNATMDHYEKVMYTVKAKALYMELRDGFDVFRERGRGRFDMTLEAFDRPEYSFLTDLKTASWMPVVKRILGDDVSLVHKGAFLSLPGAEMQIYHQDGVHLNKKFQKPCHAINVFIPLVDLHIKNGPTEFCIGTHYLNYEEYNKNLIDTPIPRAGTPVIFDYRLGHRGLGNHSDKPRPIVYLTYTRASKEFRDAVNFSAKRFRKLGDLIERPMSREERARKRKKEA